MELTLTPAQLRTLRRTPVEAARGNRIREALDLVGGSQADLARATGLNYTHVADLTRGRFADTTVQTAHALSAVFGCTIEDLFPRKGTR